MNLKNIIITNTNNIKKIIQKITNTQNEDIEQEVFIRVWQNSDGYKEKGKLKSWIATITKNYSKDYLKSKINKNERNFETNEALERVINPKNTNPEDIFIKKERQKRICSAINSLRPKFKEVIMLYEIEDLSYDEISKKLNCPIGTVKSRIYNAKQDLMILLEDLL